MPAAHWAFDESSGTTAADSAGAHPHPAQRRRLDAGHTVLTGDAAARNTLDAPEAIAPITREIRGLGTSSKLVLPPSSVTVLRVTGQ